MKDPTYRNAIRHAWDTVKLHKNLWFFGLFATFLGQMGLMELIGNTVVAEKKFIYYPSFFYLREYWHTLKDGIVSLHFGADKWIWAVWIGIFFLGIAFLLVFVAVISQGALIQGITQTFTLLRHRRSVNTHKAWVAGIHHFWRLFSLNLLKKVIFVLFTFILGFATWNAVQYARTFDIVIFILVFLLTLIVGAVLSFLVIYAAGYVVIEEYSFWDAIHEAWRLFLDHWLVSLEVAGIVVLANLGAAIVAMAGLIFFVAELAVVWVLKLALASTVLWQIGFFVGSFVFAAYIMFIGTALTVFTTALWTYLFVKMHRHGVPSRILHFFGRRS